MSQVIRVRAAHALSRDRFCLALHTEEMGDNFSIILQYDARNPDMPWSRTERNRKIDSICAYEEPGKETGFAVLSRGGDVYLIQGLDVINEKIPDASLCSDIKSINGALWVCGMGEQVYERLGAHSWKQIPMNGIENPTGFDTVDFESIGGTANNDIYVCGDVSGKSVKSDPKISKAIDDAEERRDKEEYLRLKKLDRQQRQALEKDPEGRIYHWDGHAWDDLSLEAFFPDDLYVESADKVYIGATGCSFLSGNAEDGFDDWFVHDDMGKVHSITTFRGNVVCSTSYGLFTYKEGPDDTDGTGQALIPTLKKQNNSSSPLKVQTVDDVMFYFDYDFGVYIWDGKDEWTNIPVPKKLRKR